MTKAFVAPFVRPLLLSAVLLTPIAAQAQPAIVENTKFYEVRGKTPEALRDQLNNLGPNGNWAETRWRVDWSPDCDVTLHITYIFPKWTEMHHASAQMRDRWAEMIDSLWRHERGYLVQALGAAQEIAGRNCPADAERVLQKWNRRSEDYGVATWHGFVGGVRF